MPLYEFLCKKCQIRFEALKPIEERHNANCPKCKKPAGKVMSVVNHTFGWTLSDASQERFGPKNELERDI